jgi:hypothetical protein
VTVTKEEIAMVLRARDEARAALESVRRDLRELDDSVAVTSRRLTGYDGPWDGDSCACPECLGTGDMPDWMKAWRGYYGDDFVPCPRCNGTGEMD